MNKLILVLSLLMLTLPSCSKDNKEDDDIAQAQACLNAVPVGQYAQATPCLKYVQNYTSQKANIMKCSIYMTSGGLMENKIVQAAVALKDSTNTTNKDAVYMSILSLDYPDVDQGYTTAQTADTYCQASGLPGLKYMSSLILAGSLFAHTMNTLGVLPTDTTDTSQWETAASSLLASCTSATPSTDCTTNISVLGQVANNISSAYCSQGNNYKTDVCKEVTSATLAAGSDTAALGQALYCELANKNYDATTGVCQ